MEKRTIQQSVGAIVAADIRTAVIFNKYGIDFCWRGKQSLSEICEQNGLSVKKITDEISSVTKVPLPFQLNYARWDTVLLCEYIMNNHHNYIKEILPELQKKSENIASEPNLASDNLIELNKRMQSLTDKLNAYLNIEKDQLFPIVLSLFESIQNTEQLTNETFVNLRDFLRAVKKEHEAAHMLVDEIADFMLKFQHAEIKCDECKKIYKLLIDFNEDFRRHIHLENNILFPRLMELTD